MKLSNLPTSDPDLGKAWAILRRVLSSLNLDNFQNIELKGTTASVADASTKFRHQLKGTPNGWLLKEGDVYVPKGGIGTTTIDVRSSRANEEFTIVLLR